MLSKRTRTIPETDCKCFYNCAIVLLVVLAAGCSASNREGPAARSPEKNIDPGLIEISQSYESLIGRITNMPGETIKFFDASEQETGVMRSNYRNGFFASCFPPAKDASGAQVGGGVVYARNKQYVFQLFTNRSDPKWNPVLIKPVEELSPDELTTGTWMSRTAEKYPVQHAHGIGWNSPRIDIRVILAPAVNITSVTDHGNEITVDYTRRQEHYPVPGESTILKGSVTFSRKESGLPVYTSELCEADGVGVTCQVEYEFKKGLITQAKRTVASMGKLENGVRKKFEETSITRHAYNSIPNDEFLISKYGFPELSVSANESGMVWWVSIVAVGIALIFCSRLLLRRGGKAWTRK